MNKSKKIKTVFFGTHDFAAVILQGLIESPFVSIDLVVTQPDKPVGRKQEFKKSPVKILAEKYEIKIDQPASLKNYELPISDIELGVTAQYGLLIPKHILGTPKHGILNVHTSLLPKYRGASPIQSALINGETETGVTIMKMDVGMDTGPILLQKTLQIDPDDTYLDLDKKLAVIGSDALLEAIPDYTAGELKPTEQDNSKATLCKQFKREDGKIDWTKTSEQIYNQYRGMTPWPGVWTTWGNKRLKLLKIKLNQKSIEPGKVCVENDTMYIGCAENAIEIIELQLEGKNSTDTKTFINGHKEMDGDMLI